jgi:hypothetical protein
VGLLFYTYLVHHGYNCTGATIYGVDTG